MIRNPANNPIQYRILKKYIKTFIAKPDQSNVEVDKFNYSCLIQNNYRLEKPVSE